MLRRWFRLRPGEGSLLAHLAGLLACLAVPTVLLPAVTISAFLDVYDSDALPWLYIAVAVVNPLAGLLAARVGQRVSSARFVLLQLAALALACVGLRGLLAVGLPLAVAGAAVGAEVLLVALLLVSYANTDRLFTLRQARRLAGLAGAGGVLGATLTGLSMPALVGWLGSEELVWIAAAFCAVGFLLELRIVRRFADRFEDDDEEEARPPGLRPLLAKPLVRVLFAVAALSAFAFTVLDNAFFLVVEERFSDPDALAGLLGRLAAATSILTLLVQLLLSARAVGWFGLGGALLVAPLALALGAVLLLVAPPGSALLVLASGLWVLHLAVEEGLDTPLYLTLFRPLPAGPRAAAQELGESLAGQLGAGLAGGLLLLLLGPLEASPRVLFGILCAVALVWALGARLALGAYRRGLGEALQRHALVGEALPLDAAVARTLAVRAREGTAGEARFALEQLAEAGHPLRHEARAAALSHPDPGVRRRAALALEEEPRPALAARLATCHQRERGARERGAMLRGLAACDPEAGVAAAEASLTDAEPALRRAAAVALLRSGGLRGALRVGPLLLAQLGSTDPEERVEGARRLGAIGDSRLHRELSPLLDDPAPEVRIAALRAAEGIGAPPLWPLVVAALAREDTRPAAARALLAGGAETVPALGAETDAAPTLPWRLRLLGRIGGEEAVAHLLGHAKAEDGEQRAEALRALRAAAPEPPVGPPEELRAGLERELDCGRRVLACLCGADGEHPELRLALREERAEALERMFGWLALRGPAARVWQVWERLGKGPDARALALEALEGLLRDPRERELLAFLEQPSSAEQLRVLGGTSCPAEAVQASVAADRELGDWCRGLASLGRGQPTTVDTALRERVGLLRRVPLLAHLRGGALAHLARRCVARPVAAGEVLFRSGEPGDALWLVARGRLEVRRGLRVLAEVGPEEVVGELAVLSPEPRAATVLATEASELLGLPRAAFLALLESDAGAARGTLALVAERCRSILSGPGRAPALGLGYGSELAGVRSAADASLWNRRLALRGTRLFEDASGPALSALAGVCEVRELARGERLGDGGEPCSALYVVVAGELCVRGRSRPEAWFGVGALVGALPLFCELPWPRTVEATRPARVLALSRRALGRVLESEPAAAWPGIALLIRWIREEAGPESLEATTFLGLAGEPPRSTVG